MDTDLPPGQGATAAADWIAQELVQYSADCGGCMEVKRDTFTQEAEPPPQGRIPKPTTITNVYAVLRGSDPKQAARMILVTGHYDSRNSDTMNTKGEAPGANDDASGVAVSLECARVLVEAEAAGDAGLCRGCGRGAGAQRQPPSGAVGQARGLATGGGAQQRHRRRQHDSGRHVAGQVAGAGFFRRDSGDGDSRMRSNESRRLAWRAIRPRGSWRGRSPM